MAVDHHTQRLKGGREPMHHMIRNRFSLEKMEYKD